jgi:transcription elongation factor GreA
MLKRLIYVTSEGLRQLQDELEQRKAELRAIQDERAVAHELSGDGWHDNPYFNKLQQDESHKNKQIADIRSTISSARMVVVRDGERPDERVALGAIVHLHVGQNNSWAEEYWEIVGYGETDLAARKLAYNAPRIAPVMGLEIGESAVAELNGQRMEYEVLDLLQRMPAALMAG